MWFLHWRWLVRLWKYLVFLSLQIERDLCHKNSFSWWIRLLMSALRSLMEPTHVALFSKHTCSNNFCFSCNWVFVDPKVLWPQSASANLHLFIFSKSLDIGLPGSTSVSHAIWITLPHSRWVAHRSSNLCGIFFCIATYLWSCVVISIRIGLNRVLVGEWLGFEGTCLSSQLWHMPCPTFPAQNHL